MVFVIDAELQGPAAAAQRGSTMRTVFYGEWISKQNGRDPLDCEYGTCEFDSREQAFAHCTERSKAAGCVNWWYVEERRTSNRDGYTVVATWAGNWRGHAKQVRWQHSGGRGKKTK